MTAARREAKWPRVAQEPKGDGATSGDCAEEADVRQTDQAPEISERDGCVRVRTPGALRAKQGLPYYLGISGRTSGARGISLNLIVIPPGGEAEPHSHSGFETALYVISGRALNHWGDRLQHSMETAAGDFVFIAPNVPHYPENLSTTEPVVAIVARNDPEEQEHVILFEGKKPRNEA